ncbi:MAG: bis(5'-nucleosyl)-tetraphosphatase (symmetrical) YqeK [Lachnospiraceae bacterium]|nr:bis(5'-nucleosyl)-tetraphosphatase (symmetrical) YqeK [Lachnospiraceae bacterium]
MTDNIRQIRKRVKVMLDKERYQHTLGVAYTAAALAMRYHEDVDRAFTAGLLHDCAKCIDNAEKLRLCAKYGIEVSETERKALYLLHSKLGAAIAERDFDIKDRGILDAIRYHTTGRPAMSLIEAIIFTADYIEPGRSEAPDLEEIRALAFTDLTAGIKKILGDTLKYLDGRDRPVDPATKETYDYYTASGGRVPGC